MVFSFSKLRLFSLIVCSGLILLIMGTGIFIWSVDSHLPAINPKVLSSEKQSSTIYDKDGNKIAELHGEENRSIVSSKDIPDLVKKTFVAVEDKRFYEHGGIDLIRIIGSAFNDLISGSAKEGGSTITVQLARNTFLADPTAKTLTRKVQEALLAIELEHHYSKEEILTFYLNKIYLGELSYGIESAAQAYFGKDLKQLDIAEVALLAGLPQAPSAYDPYNHPEAAEKRRNVVLDVLRDAEIITPDQYTQYRNESITLKNNSLKNDVSEGNKTTEDTMNYKFPYFVDYVVAQLENEYNLPPDQIYNGGLKIYTTIDPKIQTAAETAFRDPSNFPDSIDSTLIQGAMTVLDPTTGAIRAMVGGRDYTPRGFNRAWQAKRQPGSTIKPLVVYGPAIEKGGYFSGTVLVDETVTYDAGNGRTWSPTNFDTETAGWKGPITMRYALENSVNVYAVKLMNLIGVNYGWKFGKERLGLPLKEEDKVLSLALGTTRVSSLDMASAYGVFANNGVRVTSHAFDKVLDAKGVTIVSPKIMKDQVMKPTTAYIINDMLRSVVTNGTAYAAQIGDWAIAGKTGTTSLDQTKYRDKSGNPDAWFAGFTPNYVGIVWMGYDSDPDGEHYLHKVYGGSYPAELWKKVMTVALEGQEVQTTFTRPEGIVSGSIDIKTGLLPSSFTPPQYIRTEIAAQGDFPTWVSNIWSGESAYIKNENSTEPQENSKGDGELQEAAY